MTLGALATLGELVGFLLASYGLLRQSFADLSKPRPYGEGTYGEGTFGGAPSRAVRAALSLGRALRLLPHDRELTVTGKRNNALMAVAGVIVGALSLALELGVAVWAC